MHDHLTQLPWERPGWLDEASAWILARLAEAGREAAGPVELLHQRPWSSFARVPTNSGLVYFKAPSPPFRFEAPLTAALAAWRPDCTPPLLALHREAGWILSADAGATLRQLGQTTAQLGHWERLLPLYAELQIELADRVPELLALDVPDRRLAHMPALYALLLDDPESLLLGREQGLTPEQHRRLRDGHARFVERCAELAGYGLPETLTHEEVHENNVLFGDGRYIFTDWSDCSVSHPFFTMLVTLRAAAHWLRLDEAGPELQRLRDAYLEPWTGFASKEDLAAALELAYQLAMVNRSLSWHMAMGRLPERLTGPYADSVPGWLQDFLEATAS